jgi:hypothetical protein
VSPPDSKALDVPEAATLAFAKGFYGETFNRGVARASDHPRIQGALADALPAIRTAVLEEVREKLLGLDGFKAVLDNWPAAHIPHKVNLEKFDGLDDPALKAACAEAEGLNQDAADEIIRALLDLLSQPTSANQGGDDGR